MASLITTMTRTIFFSEACTRNFAKNDFRSNSEEEEDSIEEKAAPVKKVNYTFAPTSLVTTAKTTATTANTATITKTADGRKRIAPVFLGYGFST